MVRNSLKINDQSRTLAGFHKGSHNLSEQIGGKPSIFLADKWDS